MSVNIFCLCTKDLYTFDSTKDLVNTVYFSVRQQRIKENVYLGKKTFNAESRFLFIISTSK